jgi:hypothetical protein
MRRLVGWMLAIFGLAAVCIVLAAVTGRLTEKQQMHWLGFLFSRGLLVLPLAVVFGIGVNEYRSTGDWKSWLQFAGIVVLYGGVWSWFSYFGNHGAFFIWPVIVGVVFFGLLFAHGLAAEHRTKRYAAALRDAPPPLPEPMPGQASDDELRRRGLL